MSKVFTHLSVAFNVPKCSKHFCSSYDKDSENSISKISLQTNQQSLQSVHFILIKIMKLHEKNFPHLDVAFKESIRTILFNFSNFFPPIAR